MNNTEHIHRLSLSSWLETILFGLLTMFMSVGVFAMNAKELFSGKLEIVESLGTLLLLFTFPIGVMLFVSPFVTKIVIKPHGLEYHTAVYTLFADWKQLVNLGHVKQTNGRSSLVVIPQDGSLVLKEWAKPFPKVFIHKIRDIHISVARFGVSNGHSLETDILVNISQLGELPGDFHAL